MYKPKALLPAKYWVFTVLFGLISSSHGSYEYIRDFTDKIMQNHPNMNIGIKAVSLAKGEELCSIHEQCRFTPASNTKLFTAILALEYLSPEYRFETPLMTDGTIEDSILHGSLYLKGSGDPSLTEGDIAQLMATLKDHQIKVVAGDFCIDLTEFDDDIFQPGSFFDNVGYGWNPPTTALSVNGKAAYLKLPRGGALVRDEKLRAVVYDLKAILPAMFQDNGITLQGSIVLRATPIDSRVVATHQSEPLAKLVCHMMKNTDNLYADCIFKKVGALYSGMPGSWKNGADALKNLLNSMGINSQELVIVDGSGRSRYNLIAPAHIITALQWAYQQPYFTHLFESLSIAGVDGTLKERMKELGECIRGKTGTLSGVSALCGYASLPDDLIAFSVMVNGFVAPSVYNAPCKSEIEDAFCRCLAGQQEMIVAGNSQ
jgi:D-alanyl-D-alanine carboxypeptidase/D-alanyl-D-alanine-endopeptidase (penicillin-binding protein 4)